MAEVAVKKRGRPKKVTDGVASISPESGETTSRTTISKPKSKLDTLTSIPSSDASVAKKISRKKRDNGSVSVDQSPALDAPMTTKPRKSGVKSKTATSSVTDEASAVSKLKEHTATQPDELLPQDKAPQPSLSEVDQSKSQVKQPAIPSKLKPSSATSIPTSMPGTSSRSSFLSSFLDEKAQEVAPTPSEDSIVSDRSAFMSSKPSINNIVAGAGVSDMSSFPLPPSNAKSTGGSTMLTQIPKTFQGHSISSFASSLPPPRSVSKPTEPATFSTSPFAAFKASQALSSQAPIQRTPAPSHGLTAPKTSPPQRVTMSDQPRGPASADPTFPTRRPTEMSREQLLKDPKFRALRRRWTGLIIGIPVLITTSYVLFNRFDMGTEAQQMWQGYKNRQELGELGQSSISRSRTRGVVPLNDKSFATDQDKDV